jgi:hypothetical protein
MAAEASRFSTWRDRVARARVLIAGDVMLDRYWFGDVERISPEAPVPVVKIARSEERPGGAANVARNAAALGAQTTLVSATGADEAGATLEKLPRRRQGAHVVPSRCGLPDDGQAPRHRPAAATAADRFRDAAFARVLATKLADYERLLADSDLVILSTTAKAASRTSRR